MDEHSQGRGHVEGKTEAEVRHPQAEENAHKYQKPQWQGWIFSESLQRKHGSTDTFEGLASKTERTNPHCDGLYDNP